MRILLDECVPWPLPQTSHWSFVLDRAGSGLARYQNGELLQRAEAEFDLFVTSDQNIRYQQNLTP